MGGACTGTCLLGRTTKGETFTAVRAAGRPPRDPATGKRPPAGSYGPWSLCRTCGMYFLWEPVMCPCCRRPLRRRTRPSMAAARTRRAEKLKAATPAAV